MIDAKGRVLSGAAAERGRASSTPTLPAALPATPYARTGDLPATILIALALLLLLSRRFLPDRRNAIDPGLPQR